MRKKPRRTGEELRAIFEIVNLAEYKKFVEETISEMFEKYFLNCLKKPVPFYDSFTGRYFIATTETVATVTKAFEDFKEQLAMKLPWEEETVKKEMLSKQEMIQKIIRQKKQFGWNSVVPDDIKGVTFHQGIRPDTVIAR